MRINFAYFLEKYLVPVIYIIIAVKALFLFSAISNIFALHLFGLQELSEKLILIKEQTEFVFIFLTSILMIAIKINKIKKINKPDKIIINKFEYIKNHEVYVARLENAINNVLSKIKLGKTPMESSKNLDIVLNNILSV